MNPVITKCREQIAVNEYNGVSLAIVDNADLAALLDLETAASRLRQRAAELSNHRVGRGSGRVRDAASWQRLHTAIDEYDAVLARLNGDKA